MVKVKRRRSGRITQGDIIHDVDYIEYATESSGIVEVSKVVFPLVVVLTQDCDLEQDFKFRLSRRDRPANQDKYLLSVLVAPLYNVEQVYAGDHLSELGFSMEMISRKRTPGQYLRNNERPRYHFLDFPPHIPIVPSVVDFKHYFSVNVNYLKRLKGLNYICRLSELYREDLSVRFANYLARIGLPEQLGTSSK